MSASSTEPTVARDIDLELHKLRIWQWEGDNHEGSLVSRFRKPANETQTVPRKQRLASECKLVLDGIKCNRLGNAEDRSWTGDVTWIHIPINDMDLCERVLELLCDKKHDKRLLKDDNWKDQLHEPFSMRTNRSKSKGQLDVPFMDPKSWVFDFMVSEDGAWKFEERVQEWIEQKPLPRGIVRNIVLFMPYLHWDKLKTHRQRIRSRVEMEPGDRKSSIHPRRSLDEAAFRHHDYEQLLERNEDQVVTRYLRKELESEQDHPNDKDKTDALTLMMVDQLWLWVLDNDTIVTSFPDTYGDHNEDEHRNKKKCEFLHLECLARGRFHNARKSRDAYMLAHCIIQRSFSIFLHTHLRDPSFRYFDMFRKSIEDERARAADLFLALRNQDFHGKNKLHTNDWPSKSHTQGSGRRQRGVPNIREDIEAIANTQDIEEELRIILHIIQQQIKTLKNPVYPRNKSFVQDLEELKEDFEDMCRHARDIHERLFQTLELKQTLLSIRQNRIVLTFTVITIIFLPLGFICSIFGMNAAELTQGAPVKLSRIFTYMFPISAVISVVALLLAFGLFELAWPGDRVSSVVERKVGRRKTGADRAGVNGREEGKVMTV